MKLLLHTCCAPCSVQCVEALGEEGIKPALFWYNPNIHPYTEYRARKDALKDFAENKELALIMEDNYGLRLFVDWAAASKPASDMISDTDRRCTFCYRLRLEKAARTAAEKAYAAFSTTLLISPYQNHELVKKTGGEMAAKYGVEFFYRDFRPRFREGQNQARAAGYYTQKYCGCVFSEEERYLGKDKT